MEEIPDVAAQFVRIRELGAPLEEVIAELNASTEAHLSLTQLHLEICQSMDELVHTSSCLHRTLSAEAKLGIISKGLRRMRDQLRHHTGALRGASDSSVQLDASLMHTGQGLRTDEAA